MFIKLKPGDVITNGNFTKVTYGVEIRDIPYIVPEKFLMQYLRNLKDAEVYGSYNKINIYFKVIGTSKCMEDDEYNSLVGLDLAEYRAAISAYKKINKILQAIDNESIRLKIELHNFQNSLSLNIVNLKDKIKTLIDETE